MDENNEKKILNIQLEVSPKFLKNLENYCKITGTNEQEAIEHGIAQLTQVYASEYGDPKEAYFLKNSTAYDRAAAKNEGRKENVTKVPCYVLGECIIYSSPYYRIVAEGRLMKVPKESIAWEDP